MIAVCFDWSRSSENRGRVIRLRYLKDGLTTIVHVPPEVALHPDTLVSDVMALAERMFDRVYDIEWPSPFHVFEDGPTAGRRLHLSRPLHTVESDGWCWHDRQGLGSRENDRGIWIHVHDLAVHTQDGKSAPLVIRQAWKRPLVLSSPFAGLTLGFIDRFGRNGNPNFGFVRDSILPNHNVTLRDGDGELVPLRVTTATVASVLVEPLQTFRGPYPLTFLVNARASDSEYSYLGLRSRRLCASLDGAVPPEVVDLVADYVGLPGDQDEFRPITRTWIRHPVETLLGGFVLRIDCSSLVLKE